MADTMTENEKAQPESKVLAPSGEPASIEPPPPSNRKFIVIGVVLLLVIGAVFFYWRSTFTEDTDDAQVDGNLYQVSSRVTGHVVKVYVDDNQTVHAGDLLVEIDPTDYQVALDQAQADLASRSGSVHAGHHQHTAHQHHVSTNVSTSAYDVKGSTDVVAQAEKQVEAAQARVEQAKANATKAQLDVDRYTPLVQKDVISKQQFDAAVPRPQRRSPPSSRRSPTSSQPEQRRQCPPAAGAVAGPVATVGSESPRPDSC